MTNFPQPDNRDSKFIGYRIKRDENLGIEMSRWNYDEYVSLWSSNMDTHHVPFRQTKKTKDTVKPREQGLLSSFFLGIDWFDSWAFGLDYQALW